jgi:hypothetical protein
MPEQEKEFDRPTIVSTVNITGRNYGPGDEDALAQVLEQSEVKRLTEKGVIGGWGTGIKDGSRAQTDPERHLSIMSQPGGSGGHAPIERSVTGAHIDLHNAPKGAQPAGAIAVGAGGEPLKAGEGGVDPRDDKNYPGGAKAALKGKPAAKAAEGGELTSDRFASARAKERAGELGLVDEDLHRKRGSGSDGGLTVDDVEAIAEAKAKQQQ